MASIPRSAIVSLIKKHFSSSITDDAANEMARILEHKADEMARFAVDNARKKGRGKVTKEDISQYLIDGFDEK
jgi:histone H3/H4